MSESGPSKEELENYFKNSRAYFDELAKHYYETDREYYNKFIAPFYSPFMRIAPGGSSSAGTRIIFLVAAVLIAGIAAAVAFFISVESDTDLPKDKQRIEDVKEKEQRDTEEKKITKDTVTNKRKTLSDYEKGVEFYKLGDYTGAERYLKRVPESDKNYDDAQEKLNEIKELQKSDKNRRYVKPSPMKRTR
jgi:tetratricopeptide (TPR) repeat protein